MLAHCVRYLSRLQGELELLGAVACAMAAVHQPPSFKEHMRRLSHQDGASASCRLEGGSSPQAACAPTAPSPAAAAAAPSPPKSSKRKAAEALIAARFHRTDSNSYLLGSPVGDSPDGGCGGAQPRAPVLVPACAACSIDAPGQQAQPSAGWCDSKVSIPAVDWPTVLRAVDDGCELTPAPNSASSFLLPGGMAVSVVSRAEALPAALAALRASMLDSCVAIDLEWRPDFVLGSSSKVALIQLASATTCLLVRTSHMNFSVPACLDAFLR